MPIFIVIYYAKVPNLYMAQIGCYVIRERERRMTDTQVVAGAIGSAEHTQVTPVFIVGTGRCGSTMLSNILREHPAILSLSEFFASVTDVWTRIPQTFPEGTIPAYQFWEILSTHYPQQNVLIRLGIEVDELLYPYRTPSSRFDAETGAPAILQTTLPHLTDAHDALFDEVQQFVLSQPSTLK